MNGAKATTQPASIRSMYGTGCRRVTPTLSRMEYEAIVTPVRAAHAEWSANRWTIVATGVMSAGGYTLVLFAFQLSKAGYVVASRELSIVLSALIGSLLLREGRLPPRLAAASVVLAGVACVALAR